MKKMYSIGIIVLVVLVITFMGLFVINGQLTSFSIVKTSEETAKCIGKNSILYVQLGCHACEIQKEKFGDSYKYLTVIDCWNEREKCSDIQRTPTWIIKGEKYEGILSVEKLKELIGC